jgi:hypothetical protein
LLKSHNKYESEKNNSWAKDSSTATFAEITVSAIAQSELCMVLSSLGNSPTAGRVSDQIPTGHQSETTKALGLTVPQSPVVAADEVND